MIDNMTHKKYICQIGEKYAIMDESFQKFISVKSPTRLRNHDLRFKSPVL